MDVRVSSRDGKFTWLAEAKIDKGIAYLEAGMHQLSDRYARGTHNHNHGCFLVYIQKARCSERFKIWRDHFSELNDKFESLEIYDFNNRQGLSFSSNYVLNRIGGNAPKYSVLHVGVSVYREASARK